MAPATIPTSEPARLIAGDTWRWDRALGEYRPSDGWSLTYAFAGKGKLVVTTAMAPANGAGSGWEVTVPATSTAALPAGVYAFTAYVTKAGERYSVLQGSVTVEPNLAAVNAGDVRTYAERALEVITAKLEGRLTADMEAYQIQGRAVTRIPMAELERLRVKYTLEVRRQRNRGKSPQQVVAFVRP